MKTLVILLVSAGVLATSYLGFRWAVIDASTRYIEVVGSEGCTSVVDMRTEPPRFLITCEPVVIVNNIRTYIKVKK